MQETIYLRKLEISDVNKKYLSWVNDQSVTEFLEIGNKRLNHQDLIEYVIESNSNGRHNYAIITKGSESHIGNSSIYKINTNDKTFEMGWFIGEKSFWGGHFSSMVIFNLLKIGFIEMGLEKCIGGVNKNHVKARMTNKFAGFKEKRIENRHFDSQNKNISQIQLEITKREWLENAKLLCSKYPELYKA